MIEEVKKSPEPKKKKPNYFYRLLALLATIGLVAGAVGLIVSHDKWNMDTLRRWFAYRTISQSDTGSAEPFPYEGGVSAAFANVDGDLFSASQSGFRLYSSGGSAYIEQNLVMDYPAFSVWEDAVAAYEAGGTELRVYRERVEVFSLQSEEGAIISARLSAGGLAVVTRSSGFKGVVTVYNDKFEKVAAFRLSSAYVLDAVVSPDGKSLAAVTASQSDHAFHSELVRYAIAPSSEADGQLVAEATLPLGNQVPLELRWVGDTVRVMTDYGLVTADSDWNLLGQYQWSDRYLKQFALDGNDFSAILLAQHRAGNQGELVILGPEGEQTAAMAVNTQILSISAAGRYVAVLTADRLDIYTRDLTLYASLEETQGARQVVLRDDGSAMLVSADNAWLYIPA